MAVERIAFGDRPDAPLIVRPGDPARRRWLAAVVLGARGDYAAAAELLDHLYRDRRTPTAVRAHAAVTRAAHLRQLGGHAEARRWDGLGLALATTAASPAPASPAPANLADPERLGLDLAAAGVDALLGLAADAIGLADTGLAQRLLGRARAAALKHPSWRPAVRWHWVRAELALSTGRPDQAEPAARHALAAATEARAVRHEIKSTLVLSVAHAGTGRPVDELVDTLDTLAGRTRRARLASLEWPIQLLIADLIGGVDLARSGGCRRRGVHVLACIRRRTDPRGRRAFDRSPWVPAISGPPLLHSEVNHPPGTCRSAHSSRMECKNRP
ncbi:hypothetical protein [Pseudonocardia acaciae]|uniref:hypothetical protein n=1 Tax=Pseudonocardia acaciae TaxID=551276 RepID=UPI000687540A|nr:hypothetical protein [Pseudonocardia acaciae]